MVCVSRGSTPGEPHRRAERWRLAADCASVRGVPRRCPDSKLRAIRQKPCVPALQILVEARRIVKHAVHCGRGLDVPAEGVRVVPDILVERRRSGEHLIEELDLAR